MRDTPAGYSCVHYAVIQPIKSQQRISPQYCVHHELADRPMRFVNQDDGVQVFIEPCRVAALVEFHAPPHAPAQWVHDPAQWRVGFVQAVMSGSVIYEYGHGGAPTVRAAIGPDVTLAVDGNGKWDLATCLRFCRGAEPHGEFDVTRTERRGHDQMHGEVGKGEQCSTRERRDQAIRA